MMILLLTLAMPFDLAQSNLLIQVLLLFPSLIQLFVNRSNRFKSRKIYLFVSIDRIQVLLLFLDPTVCKSIESIQIKNNLTLHLDRKDSTVAVY
ncbi:hypothetical protein MJO28_011639 [Puccinia striiformis f. sp. tritici]|uniref:Uncharacterized protein n=1 Tax=Puccinia striiformis f. sp. tritici TaxID=168172 RepID=A0ACC0E393_9BASI|nr:hypothetical protein MJO29_016741 [Puccinia striiformis f. sp. tritici]KAI7944111.1 hypothetical protein MJO28_011639 [Puccinia striiformis f. sp. tritici]